MAEETIVTNIVAKSDFSGLIGDLTKVSSRLATLQSELSNTNRALANQAAQMQKSFAGTLRSTGQFSSHFVTLSSDVDNFGKSLESGKMKLGQYYGAWKEHSKTASGLIRDLAKQQVMMQNAVLQPLGKNSQGLMQFNVHVPQGLNEIKNKTAIASQELKIMNKVIQDGANQLINWGKNTQWAGRQLSMGLTLPIVAFGAAAQKAFLEADQQLVRLTKVYGGVAQTSAADLKKIRTEVSATARELAKTYGASYKDTISLAADIAATGKEGNDLLKATQETTRLSILGEVDRQEAMKTTLAIQSAFKQNTTELGQSINFLNAVENQTSTSLQDLVEAIPKAGPVIKAMGGSIKDLALYMTAMKEGGISASEGANAIKSALASLINPTKVAKDMFKGMGIDLGGIVTKNAGNLTGTILELQGALDKLDPLKKQQAIEQLFGKFQFARMNALFANLGKQGSQTLQVMDLMKASSKDLASIASREMTQMTESASGKYKRALETLKADMAGVGDQFLNVSTKLINIVDGVIKFVNHLPKPMKMLLGLIGGLTAIAGPVIMLTGLFANFFGYIVKGLSHFRALVKGGEGFKRLTPEILAAEQAGSLMEKTFYNDAKAAAVLQKALMNLVAELSVLETKANSATIGIGPAISTAAGAPITSGSQIMVDKSHPLVGQPYSRQMAHLIPAKTDQPSTMFGVVPNPGPVNQRIGKNIQMYANPDMPKVEGISSIRGVSTGIIPEEAAKWHSMNAALGMQSDMELKTLKAEVHRTGTITAELAGSYEALLPQMTNLTKLAADEAGVIVAELQAGKLTVDQARSKIIALNAQIETMMGQAATGVATDQGRTINLTQVPLTNQPVVTPAGKSNMKELFHKGSTKSFVDKLAGVLSVRTSGAGYSRETTIQRRNAGGPIYTLNDGNIVPGPNVNADVVPAMLTPGEFVVNAKATKENLPLLQAINGSGSNGPGYNLGTSNAISEKDILSGATPEHLRYIMGSRFNPKASSDIPSYTIRGTAGNFLGDITDPEIVKRFPQLAEDGKISSLKLNKLMELRTGVPSEVYLAGMKASEHKFSGSTDLFLSGLVKNGIINEKDLNGIKNEIHTHYERIIKSNAVVSDANNPYWKVSNAVIKKHLFNNERAMGFWNNFSSQPGYLSSEKLRSDGKQTYRSPSAYLKEIEFNGEKINLDKLKGSTKTNSRFLHASSPTPLLRNVAAIKNPSELLGYSVERVLSRGVSLAMRRRNHGGIIGLNSGGVVPGYNGGGYTGSRSSFIGSRGVRTNAFGVSGSAPYAPGLSLMSPILNSIEAGALQAQLGLRLIGQQTGDAFLASSIAIKTGQEKMVSSVYGLGSTVANSMTSLAVKTKASANAFLNMANPGYAAGFGKNFMYGNSLMLNPFGRRAEGSIPLKERMSNFGKGGNGSGGMVAYMLGGAAGTAIGGKVGGSTGAMVGGLALPVLLMSLPKLISGFGELAISTGSFSAALKLALGVFGRFAGPAAIIGSIAQGLWIWKRHAEDVGKANRAVFGATEKSLKEVGLKYVSVSDKIKAYREQLELSRAAGLAIYKNSKGQTVAGLTLTQAQVNSGIADAKKNAKETVQDFNKTYGKDDVIKLAASLKQQYISAGMSIQEATNKIYIMMKASNKGMYAMEAVSTKAFKDISDSGAAADYAIQLVAKSITSGTAKAEELAVGINNILNSLDSYRSSLVGTKDKAGNVITEAEALKLTLDKINQTKAATATLDTKTIETLKAQNLELSAALGTTESIQSVYAKMSLLQSPLGSKLDLGSMSPDAAISAAKGMQVYTEQVEKAVKSNAGLGKLSKRADALAATYKAATKAASSLSTVSYDNIIKQQENVIKVIEKELAARLKVLDAQQQSEDFAVSIKKAQMDYQNSLASGDMAAAAEAQLNIQKLTKDNQLAMSRQAIQDRADRLKNAAQAKIEAATLAKENVGKAASSAGTTATRALTEQTAISNFQSTLTNIVAGISPGTIINTNSTEGKALTGQLTAALKTLSESGSAGKEYVNDYLKKHPTQGSQLAALQVLSRSAGDAALNNKVFGSSVQQFFDAVKLFVTGKSAIHNTKDSAVLVKNGQYDKYNQKDGTLSSQGRRQIMKDNSLGAGDFFKYNGIMYKGQGAGADDFLPAVRMKATGGSISGPGTGTSDSIPAYLSNGEYVINAASVKKYGKGFFDGLNAKKFAMGGAIPGYAFGGSIGSNVKFDVPNRAGSFVNNQMPRYNNGGQVNHYDVGGLVINTLPHQNEREIAQMVVSMMSTNNLRQNAALGLNRSI